MEKRGKLTKKYFMQLPEGRYLVSNCFLNIMQPVFEEYVCADGVRDDQWQRMMRSWCIRKDFVIIMMTKSEYEKWLSKINFNSDKNRKKVVH